jgi:hypothetical protein
MAKKKDLLNIERDIPTTPEDIRALRENRLKQQKAHQRGENESQDSLSTNPK